MLPDRTSMVACEADAWIWSLWPTVFEVEDDYFTITVGPLRELTDVVLRNPPIELLTAPELPWPVLVTGRPLVTASALCLLVAALIAAFGCVR